MAGAGMQHLIKIGDCSRLARVSIVTLRHYALEQVPRLHRIVALKELGFSSIRSPASSTTSCRQRT
jgi:DNA-binding transcriptional MerR regulator